MNRGGLLFAFLAFTTLVSQGCSSSGSSSAGGACANYVSALRDASKECGRFNVSPSREADYIARFQRACEAALSAPGSGIAPSILDQCAANIRAQCGDDDACEELLGDVRGSLGEGAACGDDTQCTSGECKREPSQGGASCGKCAPAKQIGEACSEGGCVAGAACVGFSAPGEPSAPPTCVAVRTAGEGESCGVTSATEAVRCAGDLYCQFDGGSSAGKCTAPLGEGASCGIDGGSVKCKAPLSCVNERCGRLSGAGQPCTISSECASGLGCDETKVCAAIVWGPTGAACDDDLRRCDRGFCARSSSAPSDSGTCTDFIADGQPCDETKSLEQRCDVVARCIDGRCQFEDASLCK